MPNTSNAFMILCRRLARGSRLKFQAFMCGSLSPPPTHTHTHTHTAAAASATTSSSSSTIFYWTLSERALLIAGEIIIDNNNNNESPVSIPPVASPKTRLFDGGQTGQRACSTDFTTCSEKPWRSWYVSDLDDTLSYTLGLVCSVRDGLDPTVVQARRVLVVYLALEAKRLLYLMPFSFSWT